MCRFSVVACAGLLQLAFTGAPLFAQETATTPVTQVTTDELQVVAATVDSELVRLLQESCEQRDLSGAAGISWGELVSDEALLQRNREIGRRYVVRRSAQLLEISVLHASVGRSAMSLMTRTADGLPEVRIDLGPDCAPTATRLIDYYTDAGRLIPLRIRQVQLGASDEDTVSQWINPPLQLSDSMPEEQAGAVRIAMVDSGVNYRLPEIRDRLARKQDGQLVGYDFWDQDALPFDANVVGGGFHVQRHGTQTASIALREAPGAVLVPYRYPRPDMSRMRALVAHAAQNQVAVVGMPLGSDRLSDWVDFQEAAEAHPDILFVVSAGNNGRNIEQRPVYPATLDISNILVVSSADDFVRPAARTNWGRLSVDFLLPAEQRPALGFDGSEVEVSGSSYAVARMVALVARIKQHNSDWRAPQLVKALQKRYTDGIAKRWVYSGYIADPLAWTSPDLSTEPLALVPEADDAPDELENKTLKHTTLKHTTEVLDAGLAPTLDLPLDVLVLDPAWQDPRINEIVHDAMAILAQCNVRLAALNGRRVEAPEYLRDLATGSARTLMDSLRTDAVTVVFARDTRMLEPYTGEAFGRGNTRSRPWLTDSVWLTADVRDPALALAHELTHVLTNSGEHTDQPGNLMQRRTAVGADRLETAQCIALRANALEAGLVRPSVY